jgi:prepilin-type processing-associated H-X9-DG protein
MNLHCHKLSATGLTKVGTPQQTKAAFSLADLLALLGLFVLLALVLTPAMARTRVSDQGFQCLHNFRQLMAAMIMYTHDYHDLFPPNPDTDPYTPGSDWCTGSAGIGGSQEFNSDILVDPTRSLLVPYTGKNTSLFHCPADPRTGISSAPSTLGQVVPSARTCSMNSAVGTDPESPGGQLPVYGPWLTGSHGGNNSFNGPWFTYGRTTSILKPTPARLSVLLDENPNSINDACFNVSMVGNRFVDCPGALHNLGGSFAFADGHCEHKRWQDWRTAVWPNPQGYGQDYDPVNPDVLWVQERTSARK